MAFVQIETAKEVDIYSCLSTDTKSTNVDQGSICYETDTGKRYELCGSWKQVAINGALNVHASAVSYYWAGAGTTNAPTATSIPDFTLGVNSGGATTGNVYWVIGGSWVDTGATVANLFGG